MVLLSHTCWWSPWGLTRRWRAHAAPGSGQCQVWALSPLSLTRVGALWASAECSQTLSGEFHSSTISAFYFPNPTPLLRISREFHSTVNFTAARSPPFISLTPSPLLPSVVHFPPPPPYLKGRKRECVRNGGSENKQKEGEGNQLVNWLQWFLVWVGVLFLRNSGILLGHKELFVQTEFDPRL